MMKKLALFLIMAAMVSTPVLGSTDNSVDRKLAVKEDYTFEPGKAFASLNIEEALVNEFGSEPVSFRLRLSNAQWFELGDPATADPQAMEADSTMTAGATLDIRRLGDRDLEITVERSLADVTDKASWRIPIYAEVTDPGDVNLEVDGRDGLVSSGVYTIAEAHGGDYLPRGYSFTPENPQWLTIREPAVNAFSETETFRVVLENGTWYPENDARLGTDAMQSSAAVSGIEAGSISEIDRVDDKTLSVTLKRGAGSSVKSEGVWSMPVYFKVDEFGLAKVSVRNSRGEAVADSTLSKEKVVAPIRYIKTVTLTLNETGIVMNHGSEQRSLTLDVTPVNPSGNTMIPVRGVFEQLGGTVQWNDAERTVTIEAEGKRIVIHADSSAATLNGTAITLAQNPLIINGRLLIPLRSVSEQLGFGVEWLEASQKIIIRQD